MVVGSDELPLNVLALREASPKIWLQSYVKLVASLF
jgi:hypothetical protein